jgi:SAM-dependent methyltransferase
MNTDEFWKEQGLNYIIPHIGIKFPEGFDIEKYLFEFIGDRSVVEVGCGYGRLCNAFSNDKYTGYDINPAAIEKAIAENSQYEFVLMEDATIIKQSDVVLLYTVGLHISDDRITEFLSSITQNCKSLVIAEIMSRKWRRSGDPPVFNRELKDYNAIMKSISFNQKKTSVKPYKRYPNTNITFVEYEKN